MGPGWPCRDGGGVSSRRMGKLGWTDVGVQAGHLRLGSFTRVHRRGPGLGVREFMNLTEKEINLLFC